MKSKTSEIQKRIGNEINDAIEMIKNRDQLKLLIAIIRGYRRTRTDQYLESAIKAHKAYIIAAKEEFRTRWKERKKNHWRN